MNNVYAIEKSERGVTPTGLIRFSGLLAILAGTLFIAIQLIHPPDQLSSVNSDSWWVVGCLTSMMALFSLIGVAGIYGRQVKESSWLGLAGFLVFSLFWLATMIFSFVEAFILPLLTAEAPEFVEGFLGIFGGFASKADLGILPTLGPVAGVLYVLGGVLLGLATFRAGVMPRMAGVLLAFSAVATLGAAVIPHPFDRVLAVPMGIALIWLGASLWSERIRNPRRS